MTDAPYEHMLKALEASIRFGRSSPEKFAKAVEALEGYEAEGLLLKAEHEGLKFGFNNAFEHVWTAAVREPFFYNGGAQKLSYDEQALEQKIGLYPQTHTAGGYLKKVEASKATGAFRDAMLDVLREMAPLGARVVALKEKIGKRAPKPTKTSMARDERAGKAMTCQCCGRDILAETGLIAHHGYERPGTGWQTDSCVGAREVPFEVSRDALGQYIEMIKQRIIWAEDDRAGVEAEKGLLAWTYQDKTVKRTNWSMGGDTTVYVTRDTFDAALAVFMENRIYDGSKPTYDSLKTARLAQIDMNLDRLRKHLKMQEGRYGGWSQTAVRWQDGWVYKGASVVTADGDTGVIDGFYGDDIPGGVILKDVPEGVMRSWNLAELTITSQKEA